MQKHPRMHNVHPRERCLVSAFSPSLPAARPPRTEREIFAFDATRTVRGALATLAILLQE